MVHSCINLLRRQFPLPYCFHIGLGRSEASAIVSTFQPDVDARSPRFALAKTYAIIFRENVFLPANDLKTLL